MLKLPGYRITDKIYTGLKNDIYRGYDEKQQRPIIVKVTSADYPTIDEIVRLKQEYELIKNLDCEGVINAYSLERYQYKYALILEYFGGISLNQILNSRQITLTEFLHIAISLTETLAELHQVPIIHKDINPANIVISTQTGQVKLIDFGIASRLSVEHPIIEQPNLVEGTLAYLSPEQTGRMNRAIDYRTDFYSLGVTCYEMLTGRVPFLTKDSMELIHCHLAKQPLSLNKAKKRGKGVEGDIPQVVADIVNKLLAKNAEDRYKSAAGLKADLENCLSQLETTGKIEYFSLGSCDRPNQLLIPQKLYGREAEVQTLMEAFARVSQGETELVLVSGYSGIGKTSVVNEIHKPIVKARGYFITGKFDQYKKNIPYYAFIQALQYLIKQLLTESSSQLASWQEKILAALGENGQLITDIIPEMELIIGKQPEVSELGAEATQNRFLWVLQQFISVFCQAAHPLVIFIDDLQWADSGSLKLLQTLMTNFDNQYLLIIGAYRDNEVTPIHPLSQAIEKIEVSNKVVEKVIIKPLKNNYVTELIADSLNITQEKDKVKSLSELLFTKTQGNPFFLVQLLKTLYSEKLLVYNPVINNWQWNIDKIQAVGITDKSVVELIANNITKLPETTQQVLKLAACLGNQFNLEMLAIVNQESATATALQLWKAVKIGLILPTDKNYKIPLVYEDQTETHQRDEVQVIYKFLHDRVQQAAYSLIPDTDKKVIHLKIGQLLLQNATPKQREENIFALVNQLNLGIDLIISQVKKDELAQLNLLAAQKAKAAGAYASVLKYARTGRVLLEINSWEKNHELTLALYLKSIEAEYLNSNFEQANALAEVTLRNIKILLEKVKVYELQILSDIAQNQMQAAIEHGLQVLEMLGVRLEQEQPQVQIIEKLASLPEMTDSYKLITLRILMTLTDPAYIFNPGLLPLLIFTAIKLCIKYGNSPTAAYAYAYYGLLLCGTLGDINAGYRFGQLSLKMLEQFEVKEFKPKILTEFNGFVRHWKEHTRETIEPLLEAFQSGLETGDLIYSGNAALIYCTNIFFLGEHLEDVEHKQAQYLNALKKNKLEYHVLYSSIGRQLTLNLLAQAEDKLQLIGEAFNESETLPILIDSQNGTSLFYAYLAKAMLLYLFKQLEPAIGNFREAKKYEQAVSGLLTIAQHNFYFSLALLAHYSHVEKQDQSEYLNQVVANQEIMNNWAYHAPANFQHKYDLIEAEKARVLGHNWQAIELYEQAIQGAKEQEYVQEEALAHELAAEFYLIYGKEKIAQTYLIEAYYGYIRWGAVAKVKDLEARYPQFLSQIRTQKTSAKAINTTTTTTSINLAALDLSSVINASQTISQEIVLNQLLDKLMKIILNNSGAQTGYLILASEKQENRLIIEVAATTSPKEVIMRSQIPIESSKKLPISIINYVARTKKGIISADINRESNFLEDTYLVNQQPRSLLCQPLVNQDKLIGIIYLENQLTANIFTPERVEITKLLCSQAAISIENAKLYQNLQQTQLIKEAAQKMRVALEKEKELNELKSRFISMTSHEFRTPLTTILGSTELLKHYSLKWSEEKRNLYFERIQNSVQYMTELLDDVLILGKAEAGKLDFNPSLLNLEQFCRDLIEEIELGIDRTKYQIKFDKQGQLCDTYADEKLLRHILSNLLSNAVKYSPEGGTVRFTLIYQEQEVTFQVQDQGIGIPEEDQAKLFESFHRATNTGNIPGTGLGLSVVKKFVDLHRGTITVDSKVGEGTKFTVKIPTKTSNIKHLEPKLFPKKNQ